MMAKVLSYEKCKHFYELRDALADFAYEKLDIEGKLYIGKGKKFSDDNLYHEDTLADTLDELWSKPDVLDDFVNSNPAKLSDADLAIVRSWHSSLQGWFTVFKQNGKLFFLNRKRIFEVGGLLEEIDDVLGNPEYPVVVETTLLPFEEGIVYYGFMKRLPVSMGEGIQKMIDSEIEEALQDEQIFTTAEDFIKIAPKIKEEKMKEKVENTEREAALAEQGRRQMQGFHKGVLSGMSENEREEAVDAEIRNAVPDSTGLRESLIERIKGGTNGGRVTLDLEKLISKEPKPKLLRWAIVLGIDIPSEVKKPALIQALLPELSRNPFLPSLTLHAGFNLKQFEAYRRLYEAGGLLEFAENEIETISGIPSATSLICYSFYTKGASKKGGKFTFVIPDDIMEVLDGLDWDEIREHLQSREAAADIAEAASDLRGLARADDVYDEFCRFYPSSLSSEGFEEAVKDAIIEDRIGCVWLEADDGNSYLINYELAGLCREDDNPEEVKVAYKDYAIIRGKLEPLGFIIEEQKKKGSGRSRKICFHREPYSTGSAQDPLSVP